MIWIIVGVMSFVIVTLVMIREIKRQRVLSSPSTEPTDYVRYGESGCDDCLSAYDPSEYGPYNPLDPFRNGRMFR